MPGFGNNSQRSQNGGAFGAGARGTKRFSLSSASGSFQPIVLGDAGAAVSLSTSLHSGSLTAMDELYLWAALIWPGIPIISLNETVPTVVYASGSAQSKISVHGYIMRRNRVAASDPNQGYDGLE